LNQSDKPAFQDNLGKQAPET